MKWNIVSLKNTFMNSIRTYVYPQQLKSSSSISLYSKGTIDQPFYPFSSSISNCILYIEDIVGSPGSVTIEVLTRGSTLTSKSSSLSTGWNTISLSKGDIVSKNLHTLRVYGGVDSSNDYIFGSSSLSTYFYGSIDSSNVLTFKIGVEDFLYKVYPSTSINLDSYPIVVVDLRRTGRVRDKYISGDMLIEELDLRVEVYSRYTDEIDKICTGVERGLIRDRKTFEDIHYVTPGYLGDLSFLSPEIFFRDVNFKVLAFISRE